MSTMAGVLLITAVVVAGVTWSFIDRGSANRQLSADGRVDQISSEAMSILKDETLYEAPVEPKALERITYTPAEIELLKANPARDQGDALVLIGQIRPPEIDGKTLQASSIHILRQSFESGTRRILIGYALRGEQYLGAVQIIQIERGYHRLRNWKIDFDKILEKQWGAKVLQTVVFRGFDINAVSESNGKLYLGGGTSDERFKTPAALEIIELKAGLIPPNFKSTRVDLPSYTVTSIALSSQTAYLATGDRAGGVIELPQTIAPASTPVSYQALPHRFFEVEDVRDLAVDKDYVYAVKGTDAGLWVLDRRDPRALGKLINLQGATIPESKSTIELTRNSILLALGDGGVQILDRKTLELRHKLEQKQHYKNDNSLSVSNAATGHGRHLFIADGEEGARMMTYDAKRLRFTPTAQIGFGDGKSVNDIKYFNGLLIMATGMGGVKIAHFYRGSAADIIYEARNLPEKLKGQD